MALPGFQFRSISLPSRLHPLKSPKIEFQLQKLKSWQISSSLSQTAPVTSESIQSGLLRLAEMCTSLDDIYAHSPGTQESLEDSLESSMELIDTCSVIKEIVLMIRENVQSLQSALRRKGLDSGIQQDVTSYLSFGKRMHKSASKSLKKLKNLEHKNGSNNADGNFLKFLTGYAIAIFNSVTVLLSRPVTKQRHWSLVSRLMLAKSGPVRENNDDHSEVGRADFAVRSLQGRIRDSSVKVFDLQTVQKELQSLDAAMEGLEIGLERSLRSLVQIRVKLLNIITDL